MKPRRGVVQQGGENIFADLGFAEAESHFLKAQIVAEIFRLTKARKLTQSAAGKLMGVSQPEVSRLFKGHFREYSVERLLRFLARYGREVEIVARLRRKGRTGRVTFSAAGARE